MFSYNKLHVGILLTGVHDQNSFETITLKHNFSSSRKLNRFLQKHLLF